MWHFGTWFSRHGGVGVMLGLDELRGLFQSMILQFDFCKEVIFSDNPQIR